MGAAVVVLAAATNWQRLLICRNLKAVGERLPAAFQVYAFKVYRLTDRLFLLPYENGCQS